MTIRSSYKLIKFHKNSTESFGIKKFVNRTLIVVLSKIQASRKSPLDARKDGVPKVQANYVRMFENYLKRFLPTKHHRHFT